MTTKVRKKIVNSHRRCYRCKLSKPLNKENFAELKSAMSDGRCYLKTRCRACDQEVKKERKAYLQAFDLAAPSNKPRGYGMISKYPPISTTEPLYARV